MASAIRTRSRRNGLSQNNTSRSDHDVNTTITTPSKPISRPNLRKHAREASEEIQDVGIEAKRARLRVQSSPARHENQLRSRVVANTKSSVLASDLTTPGKNQRSNDLLLPPDFQNAPKISASPDGVRSRRERSNISYSDKQVIAQSANEDQGDGKRKLRSEQGAHYKSELSAYFNEYDEVIGNVVKENQLINAETNISLVDDNKSTTRASSSPFKTRATGSPSKATGATPSVDGSASIATTPRDLPDSLFFDYHDTKHFDLGFHLHRPPPPTDPLPDSRYEPAHRRLTRAEKSVRNQDKDRAQHEKDRVIQLLEGLKGHDWLKILGVTGITESKKKDFEAARKYFIGGCENIIERFRLWKEEEKKRKLEKDLANTGEDEEDDGDVSDGDPPDYSDVDASAARQLHDEAVARMTPTSPKKSTVGLPASNIHQGITSFFDNPRVREASLRRNRRNTRSEIQAFGQPLPDVEERDFLLHEELIREGEILRKERSGGGGSGGQEKPTKRVTRRSGEHM